MTQNHGLLVDRDFAQTYKRNLRRQGYTGVRVVPTPILGGERLGYIVRSNGLAKDWDDRVVQSGVRRILRG